LNEETPYVKQRHVIARGRGIDKKHKPNEEKDEKSGKE